jgi:peptide/nickel transport system permease protein
VVRRRDETRRVPLADVALGPDGAPARPIRFPLGTDHLGRDVLSRLLWAARASMLVGLLAVALAASLGVTVGSVAAMTGGWVDATLMRGVDGLLALPRLFLILLVTSLTRPDPLVVVLVLGGTGWMQISRLLRAQVLALKGSDLELAARATGRHPLAVFLRHLLPNALTPLLVDVSLRIGNLILVEAALSYLGLGIQPPVPSWGNMIADGGTALRTAWWVATPAAAATTLTVLGFHLLGDGLRDRLDPRRAVRI